MLTSGSSATTENMSSILSISVMVPGAKKQCDTILKNLTMKTEGLCDGTVIKTSQRVLGNHGNCNTCSLYEHVEREQVCFDEKNYIYVADSGNNRIQIFNPDGTFLRCFGRWGQVRERVEEKTIKYLITALHTL